MVMVGAHQVEWLKNDEPLRSNSHKMETSGSYSRLKIHSINFADTGAYMCQASSIGGLARDISSLVVQDDLASSMWHWVPCRQCQQMMTEIPFFHLAEESLMQETNKKFFVFHDWGVSVYEPGNCRLLHMIQSTDIMPGTQVIVHHQLLLLWFQCLQKKRDPFFPFLLLLLFLIVPFKNRTTCAELKESTAAGVEPSLWPTATSTSLNRTKTESLLSATSRWSSLM